MVSPCITVSSDFAVWSNSPKPKKIARQYLESSFCSTVLFFVVAEQSAPHHSAHAASKPSPACGAVSAELQGGKHETYDYCILITHTRIC